MNRHLDIPLLASVVNGPSTRRAEPVTCGVPLPRGLRAAYVRSDTLVLVTERP